MLLVYFTMALTAYMIIGSFLPMFVNISLIIPAPFNFGDYDIIYQFAHFFATGYMAFNTLGLDMLYLTLLSLCVAQLNILGGRLTTVLEDAMQNCNNKEAIVLETSNILREIVILHDRINQ
ncbi:hypothetical protein QE152_g15297 [Popillia japonica]|uniref:Odorant receptor n=1 Tax=Popillia japonica TaxID=7064 RepID=A0AAW1L629_POPJA